MTHPPSLQYSTHNPPTKNTNVCTYIHTHVILSSSRRLPFFRSSFFSCIILNNRWQTKGWRHSRHVKKVYTHTQPQHISNIEKDCWSTAPPFSLGRNLLLEFRLHLLTIIIFLNSENHGVGQCDIGILITGGIILRFGHTFDLYNPIHDIQGMSFTAL